MKAMVITGFGGPEVFEEREVPTPRPSGNEVLVKVSATSVNPVDYKIRRHGEWAGVKPPAIIGYDVSGMIEEVGQEVRDFKVGDEVFYTADIFSGQGCYAQYHVAKAAIVARKPSNLSHIEAAGIPLAGCTAWDSLFTRAQLRIGEFVLIHAGAGGVGSLAIQMAKTAGAHVFTTCSPHNMDLVKSLGADRAIDYRSEDFVEAVLRETSGAGVDVVLDTVGGKTLARSIMAARRHGRIATILRSTEDLSAALLRNTTIHFVFLERARYKLDILADLIEHDQLKPVIDSVMPLREVAKAHQKLEKGGVRGKIILEVEHMPR